MLAPRMLCWLHVLVVLLHNVKVNVRWVGPGRVPECCVKLNPEKLRVFPWPCELRIWSLVNKSSSSHPHREGSASTFTPKLLS